jgi:hypothetical protein
VTLYASNGATAARLKQQLPRLLLNFRQRGYDLTAIKVEVQVTAPSPNPGQKRSRARIPATGLASLARLEHDLEPSPLKQALTHLLQHQTQLEEDEPTSRDQGQHDQ